MNIYQSEEIRNFSGFNAFMTGGYIPVNIFLVRKFGIDAALMLGCYYEEYLYKVKTIKNTPEARIHICNNRIKELTGLSSDRQIKALKLLKENNIIDFKTSGYPARRHVTLKLESWELLETIKDEIVREDKSLKDIKLKAYGQIIQEAKQYFDGLKEKELQKLRDEQRKIQEEINLFSSSSH